MFYLSFVMNGCIVISTYPTEESALLTSKKALESRLAACVSITNVRSLYWWEGKIEDSKEYLVIFKTLKSNSEDLKRLIKENHPYTIPEIVEIDMDNVNLSYLNWMIESTQRH